MPLVIPAEMVRKHREVQQTMPTKDRLHKEIDSIADNREWHSMLGTTTVQRENAFVDRKIRCKLHEGLSISLNQLDLTGEALLARDLASHPALFPFSPGWQGECFEHSVCGIEASDRAIEVTKHLRSRNGIAPTEVDASGDLIVQQIVTPSFPKREQVTEFGH
jgi:hypothetical protein